jgi:metacaspase-1
MSRKALLLGLNYRNHASAELSGCINDVFKMKEFLVQQFRMRETDILVMTDDTPLKPTRTNILYVLSELAAVSHKIELDKVFIHYSGHGIYEHDTDDEKDGRDECLVPLDFDTHGVIRDDELLPIMQNFHPRTDIVALFDCCHSGTIVDMPYRYVGTKDYAVERNLSVDPRIITISGCMDDQTSAEIWFDQEKSVSGVMTSCFLTVMKEHDLDMTCLNLIRYMQKYITDRGFEQKPQLCCSKQLSESCIFVSSNLNSRSFWAV